MRAHSATLVDQALLLDKNWSVSLSQEMWHEGLEAASKLYFWEHNILQCLASLSLFARACRKGNRSAHETQFIQSYGHELKEARELGIRYKQSGNSNDLNAAWDLYYQVFRRINKVLPVEGPAAGKRFPSYWIARTWSWQSRELIIELIVKL